jgi:transposase
VFNACPSKPSLIKHLSKDELEKAYKLEKDSRIKERLLAILLLFEGKKVPETAAIVRRGISTLELWIRNWNQNGVDGLKTHFTGGPKPKVPKAEWDKIVAEIENKAMTINDVATYVANTRGVCYTYKSVWEILRKKRHLCYGKPYEINQKRSPDAEAILKKARGSLWGDGSNFQ